MVIVSERVSVVMPVYNEAPVIARVVEELQEQILDKLEDAELVIVNDASTDATPSILDGIAAADSRIVVEHARENRGHGPTLRQAMDRAGGEWIFHIDSDRQFVAGDFWSLWGRRHEMDLVLGYRAERHDPRHRLLLTRVVRFVTSMLAGRRLRDANVPFKLIARPAWERLAPIIPADTLAPSIFISLGAAALGMRMVEVPVQHLAREHGPSTLRLWRLVRFSLTGLKQLIVFRASIRRELAIPV